MNQQPLQFKEFSLYAGFLLGQPALFRKLQSFCIQSIRAAGIPALEGIDGHDKEEKLEAMVSRCVEIFLQQVMENKSGETSLIAFKDWGLDDPQLSPIQLEPKDLLRIWTLMKLAYLESLPDYTADLAHYSAIVRELEMYQVFLQEQVLQHFSSKPQVLNQEKNQHETKSRQEAEDTIRRARDFYLQILEDMPALIWRSGIDGQCDYFNKEWLAYTGCSMEDSIGEGWLRGVHPDDREYCMSIYLNAFKARESFEMEYRLQRHDGEYHYIVDYGKPVYGPEGDFIGYVGTCFDIQERINDQELIYDQNRELAEALLKLTVAEEKLRENNTALEIRVQERTNELAVRENFLNSIIEQSPFSTWIADSRGTMVQVNPACLALFGIQNAETVVGHYNILQDSSLISQRYYKDIKAVFEEGKVARFELENYRLADTGFSKLKSEVNLSLVVSVFPIKNEQGEITNAVIKHEDITERKIAELALQRSEEQLRMITDSLPVLISYIDNDQRYRFVNKAYEELFKKPKSKIIGQKISEVMGLQAYKNVRTAIEKVLDGEPQQLESSQNYGEAGARYLSITLIPDHRDKQVVGFYALGYDISERRKTEQELERLYAEARKRNKDLNRINTDLDNFVYTASHDLKAPVANLEGLLNLILQRQKNGQEIDPRLFSMMNISVGKLKRTIDDLVEITKVQKQIDRQFPEKISFPQVTEDILQDLQTLIDESSAEIREEYEVAEIHYAKSHLRSIMYNLLSNSLKYRSPDRKVQISVKTTQEKEGLVLQVRDNGLGMSEGQQKKLFTMFHRMHSHIEGTGIGLYTIKRIIENNGGSIQVQSQAGKGTLFRVVLICEQQDESLTHQLL